MIKRILGAIIVLALLTVTVVACDTEPVYNKGVEAVTIDLEQDGYQLLKEFTSLYPDRTAGIKPVASNQLNGADSAGEWIAGKLADIGYAEPVKQEFSFVNPFANDAVHKAFNVVVRKQAVTDTQDLVVIGAHYDNAASIKTTAGAIGGEGAYNNAVGVIALLQTAIALKDIDLPFNVDFVAFGAEEEGSFGSKHYIDNMKEDLILMINYDRCVGGEYAYMYSDEISREHNELFYSVAEENNLTFTKMPDYKKIMLNTRLDGTNWMYMHEGLTSDHLGFMMKGYNVVNFISMNFSDRSSNITVEYSGKSNVSYTEADTVDTMVDRLGGGETGINAINDSFANIVTCTVKTLQKDNFVSTMRESMANRYDYSASLANYDVMMWTGYGISIAVILALLIAYFAVKSKAKQHRVMVNTPYGKVDLSSGTIIPNTPGDAGDVQPKKDPFDGIFDGEKKEQKSTEEKEKVKDVKKKDIFEDF